MGPPLHRLLRRGWRSALRRLRDSPIQVAYSRHYDLELTSAAWDPLRARRILSFLLAERLLGRGDLLPVRPVSIRRLLSVHSDAYLESLQERGAVTGLLGFEVTDEQQDALLASHRAMVGGTLLAARRALATARIAVNLGGGFHHATADRGQGFCAFNDVAVSIADCRRHGFGAPVLVIDLDLHDGDGTRSIFAEDPTVHTFSIHNRDLGSTEAVASTSIALGDDVGDAAYLEALRESLPELLDAVRPGLVYLLAGTDPAHDDALGNWDVSAAGLLERDRSVIEPLREAGKPLVFLLAGGYGQSAWRHSARSLSWILGGLALEPPRSSELTLRDFRRVARSLRVTELTAEPGEGSWSLTEEDLAPTGRPTRFLGYYTRHGIELALERYGIFDRLRSKGFADLHIDLDLDNPSGQTVRILCGKPVPATLVELRLRLDTRSVSDARLLAVEWLLLQDPRRQFTASRPQLPGQKHPGLGLLGEFAALLVLVCDRLELAGLTFVPTHYHIAAQTAPHDFHFLDPEAHGRFLALRAAVKGLHLSEVIRAIEEGRIVDRSSGTRFAWQPATMVLPAGEALRRRFRDPLRRQSIAAAGARYDFAVRDSEPGLVR